MLETVLTDLPVHLRDIPPILIFGVVCTGLYGALAIAIDKQVEKVPGALTEQLKSFHKWTIGFSLTLAGSGLLPAVLFYPWIGWPVLLGISLLLLSASFVTIFVNLAWFSFDVASQSRRLRRLAEQPSLVKAHGIGPSV